MEQKTARKKTVRKTVTAKKPATTKRNAKATPKTIETKKTQLEVLEEAKIFGVAVTDIDTHTNLTGYGPKWLLDTITNYINQDTSTIIDIIGPEGYNQLLNMAKNNIKVGTIWQQAKHTKALKLAQKGQLLFETSFADLPEELFSYQNFRTSDGALECHRVLTASGVSYLKAKAEQYTQAARRTESGRIGDTDHEPASVVIHNNINLNLRDIMQRDITELSSITNV